MPTFRDRILSPLDKVRGIGGRLGLRSFVVTVRRRVWSGSRPGLFGTSAADTDTVMTCTDATGTLQPVIVRQVSRREAIASGGLYTNRDLKVGPMTPPYPANIFGPAGGFSDTVIDPAPVAGLAVEMIWIVTAPGGTFGIPAGGAIFDKIGEEATDLHTYVYLRQTGRVPTPPPQAAKDDMEIHITVGTASQASAAQIPAGADVLRAYVRLGTPYSPGATLTVGNSGNATLLSVAADVNLQHATPYEVDLPGALGIAWGGSPLPVLATIAGAPSVGSLELYVVYNPSPQN